jgi:multiple sugar transport system permease protein
MDNERNIYRSAALELRIRRFFVYIVMIILGLLALVPIYLLLINATRSTEQINMGISVLPSKYARYNWSALTNRGFQIWQGFYNSAFLSVATTILAVYFSSMTAYGLHIYRFKGRRFLWGLILLIMMLPGSLSFIGFYQFMARLHLLDNYIPLIIPAIAGAATVLFLRQYMTSVLSVDLIDAARIDGAGEFRIFNIIILPVITPAIAAQAIFTFVASWNNFFSPFVLISSTRKYTLPMLVQMLRGDIYRTEMGGIYLGIAISLVPILFFYSFMSRFIISGITMGSVKE